MWIPRDLGKGLHRRRRRFLRSSTAVTAAAHVCSGPESGPYWGLSKQIPDAAGFIGVRKLDTNARYHESFAVSIKHFLVCAFRILGHMNKDHSAD
jgi:hypothetical protein